MPLTRFVGRRREVVEVGRMLGETRLLTLTGAGGVGKTRLALEVARLAAPPAPGGVALVALGALTDPGLVAAAVAVALGMDEGGGQAGLMRRLAHALRARQVLLLLDDCEHLLEACAAVAVALLGACPRLTLLATSRQPLGIPGEVTWRVPSLAFPHRGDDLPVERLAGYEAVQLFVERAGEARPGFALDRGNAAAVAAICCQLDGIPFALELAAARVRALSAQEIAAWLGERVTSLGGGGGELPRQRTLRASIEWSHQLLDAREQALLRRLAVFVGGWTLPAARTVAGAADLPASEVVGLLARLVDRSLVWPEPQEHDGHTRYRLLGSVRELACERLAAAGEDEALRERHARWFLALAEQAAAGRVGPAQGRWLRWADAEHDNLHAAARWCAARPGRADLGLRLAAALWELWQARGRLAEGARWLQDALEHSAGHTPSPASAEAMVGLGVLASTQGDQERACELLQRAADVFAALGQPATHARALTRLGLVHTRQWDALRAAGCFRAALSAATAAGDAWQEAFTLCGWGRLSCLEGQLDHAEACLERSCALFRAAGDGRALGFALAALGSCYVHRRDGRGAAPILAEALGLFGGLGDRWGLLTALAELAMAEALASRHACAARAVGTLDGLRERMGAELPPTMQAARDHAAAAARTVLGEVAFGQATAAARALPLDEALALLLPPAGAAAGRASGPAARGAAAGGLAALTPREREVAVLLGEGLTNRQLAARLVIAERTADTHVQHILAKLQCSSRVQVAVLLARQQPGGTPTHAG